jgi:hypothetical protein
MRRTFTHDQGKEMSRHNELSAVTGVKVYFCDQHSPWQRGICENNNGLLRQYLPKVTYLSVFSLDKRNTIADSLSNRPRATLGFNIPLAVVSHLLAIAHQRSISIHYPNYRPSALNPTGSKRPNPGKIYILFNAVSRAPDIVEKIKKNLFKSLTCTAFLSSRLGCVFSQQGFEYTNSAKFSIFFDLGRLP